jgi:transcriptional regulator with XRE-family HTH domain
MTRPQLAAQSEVSPSTIKAYELGRRRPSREHLTRLLDELRVDRAERRSVFESAGFAPDERSFVPEDRLHAETYSQADAAAAVDRYKWPAFVVDKFLGVVAANRAAQTLWGVDLDREFQDPLERNLLSVATNPRFADRIANWDEAVGHVVAVRKAHDWAPEQLEAPSPYLSALLERLLQGDPKYVARLIDLWQKAPEAWSQKMRWSYPLMWVEPGIGTLRFECLASTASELEGLAFNDWIPTDSLTWLGLEKLSAGALPLSDTVRPAKARKQRP